MVTKTGSIVFKLFTLIVFAGVSFVTLLFAYGYQFDVKERDVIKTSIIDVIADLKGIKVSLDGIIQTEQLPYQLKSVVPGSYDLEVTKEGFLSWRRMVVVKEDIVSIVNDVLLVPDTLSKYEKRLMTIGKGLKVYYGNKMMILVEPGEKKIRLITFYGNGTYKDDDFELNRQGILTAEMLSKSSLLLHYSSNVYGLVNFSNRSFKFFSLPEGIERIGINADDQVLYYLLDGSLYRVPLYILGEGKVTIATYFPVGDKIDQYASGFNGQLFYVSGGGLYLANDEGLNPIPVDGLVKDYVNLSFASGKSFGALILRSENEQRKLYMVDRNANLVFLTGDLKGQPYFNDYDQLIFADMSGQVHYYDPNTLEKKIIKKVEGDFEIIGWFSNEGHFLVIKDSNLYLNDVYDANGSELINQFEYDRYFVLDKCLFFVRKDSVNSLYWMDGLK